MPFGKAIGGFGVPYSTIKFRAVRRKFSWGEGGVKLACADKMGKANDKV